MHTYKIHTTYIQNTYIHTYIHIYIPYIHTYTYIHTYIHTYTHTHTHSTYFHFFCNTGELLDAVAFVVAVEFRL